MRSAGAREPAQFLLRWYRYNSPVEYRLDRHRVRHGFNRCASVFERYCELHDQVRRELLARLDIVDLSPDVIVDLGCGTGRATRQLRKRFGQAQLLGVDSAPGMLARAAGQRAICADARELPLADNSTDLVVSNLMLGWCHDPDRVFAECRRVLRYPGLLAFATFGPDTLKELRDSWNRCDRHMHLHGFVDMHDLGDALLHAGFADPVMDVLYYTLTYPSLTALFRELRGSGSINALPGRPRGLAGRTALQQLDSVYRRNNENRLAVTVEVIFGHAWTGQERRTDRPITIAPGQIGRRRG